MAKYYGMIGYAETIEDPVGSSVWVEKITEYPYYGDIIRTSRRIDYPNKVNGDVTISNEISIVSDPYANEHFQNIRYATYGGTKWVVATVEIQYPRLVLSLGGIYNG